MLKIKTTSLRSRSYQSCASRQCRCLPIKVFPDVRNCTRNQETGSCQLFVSKYYNLLHICFLLIALVVSGAWFLRLRIQFKFLKSLINPLRLPTRKLTEPSSCLTSKFFWAIKLSLLTKYIIGRFYCN